MDAILPARVGRTGSVLVICLLSAAALAQPVTDRRHEAAEQTPLRDRLQMRLERLRNMEARVEQAIKMLDNGERPDPAMLRELDRSWGDPPDMDSPERPRRPDRIGTDREPAELPDFDKMKAFVESKLPWLATRLMRAEKERPGSSEILLRRAAPRIAEVMRASEEDPQAAEDLIEQFRLGADMVDTSMRIRRALDTGEMTRDQALAAFRKLAQRHIELRQRFARHEIAKLHSKISELEQGMEAPSEQRERLLDEMAGRMLERALRGDRMRDRDGPGPRTDRPSRRP